MNILFVVCGEGLGHASRCLHLGHYIQQQGHTVHFAAYGKSYGFMEEHSCSNLHHTQREVCLEGENGLFSMKMTLWCSKWIAIDMVLSGLRIGRLIHRHAIDCVVCDTMFAGVLIARLLRTPVVFITNQNHFNGVGGTTNPVWRMLNFLIRGYIRIASRVVIPDYPAPDTVSEYNIRIPKGEEYRYHFTGPFLAIDMSHYSMSRETIFCSFGGEPYKLPMYRMLRRIADARPDLLFDVFYTGEELPESSSNFVSHGYVPNLYEHLAKARIAIVHGGLTTLHEALLFEKPVLIVMDPGHPEQQNNARKIIDMGAGTAINGRNVTEEDLEAQLARTMELVPKPFCDNHVCIDGRRNAFTIIAQLCGK
jgi:uncharacterized protein (TIGR00661 family)